MSDVDWAAELQRKLKETSQSQYFTAPKRLFHGSQQYGIQTLKGYAFDHTFWRVFSALPFKVHTIRPEENHSVVLEWTVEKSANLPLANHHWQSWGTSRPWNPEVYPMGIRCSAPGCGLGMDRHPAEPGHVLPTGEYDAAQA